MQKPFAVIVTTSPSDLSSAALVAAAARALGAVVETPLAHSPVQRQLRRAKATASHLVAVISGGSIEIHGVSEAHWSTSQLDVGAGQIAAWFKAETLRDTVVPMPKPSEAQTAALARAA